MLQGGLQVEMKGEERVTQSHVKKERTLTKVTNYIGKTLKSQYYCSLVLELFFS